VSYTLTKTDTVTPLTEEIIVTVTSEPLPGVQPIIINTRMNEPEIDFTPDSEVIRRDKKLKKICYYNIIYNIICIFQFFKILNNL